MNEVLFATRLAVLTTLLAWPGANPLVLELLAGDGHYEAQLMALVQRLSAALLAEPETV